MQYKFIGDLSEIFPGLPTRDMSQAEWDAAPVSNELKEAALSSGIYIAVNEDE